MSKIGRGGDSGILSICIQPSGNSFSQNSPSPGAGALGHAGPGRRREGPTQHPPFGHLLLLGFQEGQVPSCPGGCRRVAVFRAGSPPGCGQEASCRGSCDGEHPPSARPCGFPSRDLITGRMSGMNAGCADPSGTRPVPPLGLGQCTHFTTLASSSLSVLSSVTSSSACPGM